ncbi:molybdenum cofactor biosynthesis protein A [Pseudomonas sp. BAY1663]|nr:molybdenum cofactor biosynthesis protein A [Pseudomonas sp. BAY1663]
MTQLRDAHDRQIDYLRMSVTDRCDFRCVYCMAEDMTFLPRQQVLGLEELERIARIFVGLGVKKIRLTGGEPLVRQGIVGLCERIAALPGLRELVMTTNGSQLVRLAEPLARAGVKRLNISWIAWTPRNSTPLPAPASCSRCSTASMRRAPPASSGSSSMPW